MSSLLSRELANEFRVAVGEKAPDFELRTEKGEKCRLSAQTGKTVALLFYPKNETLVCTKQLCSVRDNWTEYLETKALVVGISHGGVEEHQDFARRHRLPIPLLADVDRSVTETYNFHWLFPSILTRAVVIVDAKGIIRSRNVMLRAFRPSDRSVITSIYAARADSLSAEYALLKKDNKLEK